MKSRVVQLLDPTIADDETPQQQAGTSCSRCGEMNPREYLFCSECGNDIEIIKRNKL